MQLHRKALKAHRQHVEPVTGIVSTELTRSNHPISIMFLFEDGASSRLVMTAKEAASLGERLLIAAKDAWHD